MKNQKGITLISVILYVIGMLMVVSIISILTGYFYQNVSVNTEQDEKTKQFTKLTSYLTQEINTSKNQVVETKTQKIEDKTVSYIIFSSGNQYTYLESNQSIYQNNIKIATQVELCTFSSELIDGKWQIKLDLKIGNLEKVGENQLVYTIKD